MTLWDDSDLDGAQKCKQNTALYIRGTEVKCNKEEGMYPTSTVLK